MVSSIPKHKPHHFLPWRFNPHVARKLQRHRRLARKGLTFPDKASMRAAAIEAAASHPIRKV